MCKNSNLNDAKSGKRKYFLFVQVEMEQILACESAWESSSTTHGLCGLLGGSRLIWRLNDHLKGNVTYSVPISRNLSRLALYLELLCPIVQPFLQISNITHQDSTHKLCLVKFCIPSHGWSEASIGNDSSPLAHLNMNTDQTELISWCDYQFQDRGVCMGGDQFTRDEISNECLWTSDSRFDVEPHCACKRWGANNVRVFLIVSDFTFFLTTQFCHSIFYNVHAKATDQPRFPDPATPENNESSSAKLPYFGIRPGSRRCG
ncbi:hypothetical protein VNO77_03847 [Canavalia gladiata]|uniref:Uncharacterized protein n=1 Tax=Canavalia gladiata TaxID=3824 RepID=A0AAN9MVF5_CANGL